jgi:TonB-dependent receptor
LNEGTTNSDAYDATLNVYAAYLMADVSLARDLRLIVGERLEITNQTIDPYHQNDDNPDLDLPETELESTDLLPAIALVYSPTEKTKTRASVTRTLARPQLRELAQFAFNDYFGGRAVTGNPDLSLTHITNADLRFEYFPTLSEVLAFSIFYKLFEDPIEQVLTSSSESGAVTTYQNAKGARLLGIELEARKGLDFLSDTLRDVSVISNLTLSKSRIEVRQTDRDVLTNLSRAMVNQAPYVFNLALDWTSEDLGASARVSYNLIGPRIVGVGTKGLDDAFEQERHTIDVVASKDIGEHFEIKVSGSNVLNSDYVVTQGADETDDNVIQSYSDGAVYTLSGTYTY